MNYFDNYEKSLLTTYKETIYDQFVLAINKYQLIQENDRICVCISGGKDSMILAKIFMYYQKHSPIHFDVEYLVMNPGYNELNLELIIHNLELLKIPATIKNTDIFEIANIQDKSPCFLCAKMRRGALYNLAKSLNCNKIALGHHFDDVNETILMNMLNSGSYQTMLPKLKSTNNIGMEVIRPLYLIKEKDIISYKDENNLHFIQCACKFTEEAFNDEISSKRKQTKKLIELLKDYYQDDIDKHIFESSNNVNLDGITGYHLNNVYYKNKK